MIRPPTLLLILAAFALSACSKKSSEPAPAAQPAAVPAAAATQGSTSAPAQPAAQQPAAKPPVKPVQPVPAAQPQPPAQQPASQPGESTALPDQNPVATYRPMPGYPMDMRQRGVEGEVMVNFTITPQGTVADPEITSSTDPEFTAALLAALPQWRFQPARAGGKPVERRVSLVVPFVITDRNVQATDVLVQRTEKQPILTSVDRPMNPDKRTGEVVATIHISATSLVEGVDIDKNTAGVDPTQIKRLLSHWEFMPFIKDGNYVASDVKVGLTYAPGGSVLIQYPYPTPPPNPQQ